MPEGHSVHRIARQFAVNFVGHRVSVSSPQGRFAADATRIDGHVMTDAKAVGKQMFLEFDNGLWLRVHLGLYGAWDFAGDISIDPTIASANGRMGQTNQRGTDLDPVLDSAGENSLHSIGAPRRTRLRMAESEKVEAEITSFPPEPIGQVRVRLLTDTAVADLRGPTACEVLDPAQVDAVIAKLGPDPQVDDSQEAEDRFVSIVRRKPTAIALLLMDQSVVSGIGNVYRAELLFRARQNPHTPGKQVPEETVRALWRDWVHLLRIGVETGQMMTMDDLDEQSYRKAMANRDDRHWVYKREGLPCRVCGTNIVMEELGGRKLYWCPVDQA
ncbi:endonuclease-8 [Leifsonia sp. 98AMF]|uniref:Fpg/Nei family DNA glycosylase n=1 Tax=unclassified Leifsonia TaxID=2663824 RepID=UPI00087B56F6|nr:MULTISPECIES: DNA glycosylase [unclassified Leifsonia]SDH30404.1 endonuclease-8 [Leifsonia sp. 197AMF]SDJ05398.1 endonuclease-8 [Leifsonia sp. 466MF]SDJ66847.1 endonuclease-8 [Leifsonia sp. 157MF]SDN25812.1 endonuclease-8 [Leifsonia sp. 509MF]SEM94714.1 endonuclease-8 [Leifsonia sp. 467MF]